MTRKIYIILMFTLLSCINAFAQVKVSGVVRDSAGETVIGAAVMLVGNSSVGVVTDNDGKYSITIPENKVKGAKLEVSCLGYTSKVVELAGKSILNIVLETGDNLLEETVVVGYGAMRRSDLTGSVTSVRIDDTEAAQSASLDQLLQGRAAGVQIVSSSAAPDAGVNIRVRGMTSLTGSSEPLYVVDGVILTAADSNMLSDDMTEGVNNLMGLNPQDIASIEILKDASATAIYGADGANGVVLITTKESKRDKPVINFNVGMDYITKYKRIDVLDFDEYAEYVNRNAINSGRETVLEKMYEDPTNREGLQVTPIDWQDYSLRNTMRQRYYLSVSGRPQTLSYTFSMGYNKQEGIVKNTGLDSYTIRLNANKSIAKIVKVGTKINYAYTKSRAMQGANTNDVSRPSSSMMRSILTSRPFTTGELSESSNEIDWGEEEEEFKSSPATWIKDAYSRREQFRVTPNLFVEVKALPWLTYKVTAGGDYHMAERTNWKGPRVNSNEKGAYGTISDSETLRWNVDNLLMFNKEWEKHSLSGTLGMTIGSRQSSVHSIYGYNIGQYDLQSANINSAPNTKFAYSESKENSLSYFARAIYNYADRYVLTATARADGSSKFTGDNVYSFFPSFAAAWRVNQEPWFNAPVISTMKLRLGWGTVGNSGVSAYQTFVTYGSDRYPSHADNSGFVVGMHANNLANSNLKWETTQQWNLGLDYAMWGGRLALTVDVYDKYTRDLLNAKLIPTTTGFEKIWVNQGIIRNQGLEITVDATPVKVGDFEWNLSANISFNRNRIEDIGTDSAGKSLYLTPDQAVDADYYYGASVGSGRYLSDPINIFVEGQPIGLFYGYKTDGIIQEGETGPGLTTDRLGAGSIKYVDLNGNGYIEKEDRTIVGDPNPDFIFGFNTSFTYKRLTLSASFNGSYGNDICNANLSQEWDTGNPSLRNVRREAYFNAWTPSNPNTNMPSLGVTKQEETALFTDRIVEDGSYLRLSNLSLSYSIPFKKAFIKSLGIGASAGNLFVFTKYSGWDPEVNSYGGDMNRIGIDFGSYPSSRVFCFDLKFTF